MNALLPPMLALLVLTADPMTPGDHTRSVRVGDRDRPDEHRAHPGAERRGAAPADAGCCRGWDSGAGPCPARWRTGCCPDGALRAAGPCPARSRRGCCRGGVHRLRRPDAGRSVLRRRPRAARERPEPQLRAPRTAAEARALWGVLLWAVGEHRVGGRPGRCEPRAVKRRPKNFPRLSQPRETARRRLRRAKPAGRKR